MMLPLPCWLVSVVALAAVLDDDELLPVAHRRSREKPHPT
jgi:hypothetical protein